MHDFNEGTVLLYEKMQLGNEIVQYHMENKVCISVERMKVQACVGGF
jgi:hypothetical protein